MKQLNNYITEKLIINKDSKSKIVELDKTNTKLMIALVKSVFISVYKNRTYKQRGLSQYTVKRSEINWSDVVDILSSEYNFNIDKEDALQKNGKLQTLIRRLLDGIEKLINMKKMIFKIGNEEIPINGHDIYWQDWKDYVKKYELKGY